MFRIGYAEDIHKLIPNRKLILAGMEIPYELGLLGHSDADVVYHAVAESLLGALALGDLGKHFPDTDKNYKDFDSSKIVEHVFEMVLEKGYVINNIDISIILQKPRLSPYIDLMRENIAKLLKTSKDNVSLKAGTNEELDDIGKGLAIKAVAVVLLRKK